MPRTQGSLVILRAFLGRAWEARKEPVISRLRVRTQSVTYRPLGKAPDPPNPFQTQIKTLFT